MPFSLAEIAWAGGFDPSACHGFNLVDRPISGA